MRPKYISTSQDYEKFFDDEFNNLPDSARSRLINDKQLRHIWLQMLSFRPEFSHEILESSYSPKTGRPAMDPVIIIRSLLLMLSFGCLSVTKWISKVKTDIALQFLMGSWKIPSVGSHYDLMNRLLGIDPHMDELYPKGKNPRPSKRKKNYKRGKKANLDEGKTKQLAEKYRENPNCDQERLTRRLEQLFDLIVVRPSCEYFSILEDEEFTLSGDGTALPVHSSPYGHRVKDPVDEQHSHRYADPDADWGWDSYNEKLYFGHSLFGISYHREGLDLPMFLTKNPASMHDSLPMISAVAHMQEVNPSLKPRNMCFDAAGDGEHNHIYLIDQDIRPFIKRNSHFKGADKIELPKAKTAPNGKKEHFNKDGVPVCMAEVEMPRNGYDKKSKSSMFRCPLATGKIKSCPYEKECNKTSYGRVLRVPDKTNLRLFGPISYKSKRWQKIYNNRTSCERMNNRILRDYNVEAIRCRTGDKLLFFAMLAGILIHLDAWIKIGR